jgi:hypothetical protein
MDAVADLSWRLYPAALLMAAGSAVAAAGLRREIDGILRPVRDPDKVLTFARGFRLAIIGGALAAIGAAWAWHLTWLLVLALVIGGEETLEGTLIIFALTRGAKLRLRVPGG